MKILFITIFIIVIFLDILFYSSFGNDYSLIYYFTISYIVFFLYAKDKYLSNALNNSFLISHFLILFIVLSTFLRSLFDIQGIGHFGDFWGRLIIPTNYFVYPNIAGLSLVSICLMIKNSNNKKIKVNYYIYVFIILFSIIYGVFYYYNINYSFKIDYPY